MLPHNFAHFLYKDKKTTMAILNVTKKMKRDLEIDDSSEKVIPKTQKIPFIIIVAGFTGSGKTGLIRCIIREIQKESESESILIVMNDGPITGLNPQLVGLRKDAISSERPLEIMMSQDDKCICCDESSFDSLLESRAQDFSTIIVELNGAANLSKLPFSQIKFRVAKIAVVNSNFIGKQLGNRSRPSVSSESFSSLIAHQFEDADLVVNTGPDDLCRELCAALNPRAKFLRLSAADLNEMPTEILPTLKLNSEVTTPQKESIFIHRIEFTSRRPFDTGRFLKRIIQRFPIEDGYSAYSNFSREIKSSASSSGIPNSHNPWTHVIRAKSDDLWLTSQSSLVFNFSFVGCQVKLNESSDISTNERSSRSQTLVLSILADEKEVRKQISDDLESCLLSDAEFSEFEARSSC